MTLKYGKWFCDGCQTRITETLVHGTRYGKEHLCPSCRKQLARINTDAEYCDAVNAGAAYSDDEVMP